MVSRVQAAAGLLIGFAPLAVLALFVAWAQPARASVPPPLAPTLYVEDAPFTRNAVVDLWITADWTYPSNAVEWRASNDSATTNGVLTNGSNLGTGHTDWPVAAGPDGPRTIYAQVRYADNAWSPVASLQLELDTTPVSRFVIDLDPQPGGYTISVPPGTDWHVQSKTPDVPITAYPIPQVGDPHGFWIGADTWWVRFYNEDDTVAPGVYQVPTPVEEIACGAICVQVGHGLGNDCWGGGTFTIVDAAFTDDGDVAVLDADFHLVCAGEPVMAGSIRYGSSRGVVAIDQSADAIALGSVNIGDDPVSGSVTLTNAGTLPDSLGTASLSISAGDAFSIANDSCSGATLDPGEACSMTVSFSPTDRGNAGGKLTIADGTAKQGRTVGFGGSGFQPVTLDVDAPSLPGFGPASATVVVTAYPALEEGTNLLLLSVDDTQQFQPVITNLTGPSRTESSYTVTLGPGSHHLEGSFSGGFFYNAATNAETDVEVGTATSLELTTVTDDGVANGESADLIARLTTGGPVTGTLRIRDGLGGPIIATQAVSGSNPSLTHTVTKGLGTHAFEAEFVPGAVDIQDATDDYDLVVVSGTRPETTMDSTPLTTWNWQVLSAFGSPTAGATFECRVNLANWNACTSPWWFSTGPPGTVDIKVRARLANGLADRTPATRAWTFDPNLTGTVSIAGGATYAASTAVSLSTPKPAGTPTTQIRLSNNGSTWVTRSYAVTQAWTLPSGSGTKKVWTQWGDGSGSWTSSATDTILLDTTDPTATTPSRKILAGKALSSGRLVVRIAWSGSDAGSGIARYDLERKTGSGAWGNRTSQASPFRDVALSAGHWYTFRVRAVDKAGNAGTWRPGSAFRLTQYSQSAAAYYGSWSMASSTSYVGGSAKWSSTAGSRLRFTFTGRSVGWLSDLGPTRGRVAIYVNGVYIATVDLYASSPVGRFIAWSKTWSATATRTVEIRVLSTPARPRVDIDGFWVGT